MGISCLLITKRFCSEFFGDQKCGIFEPKSWWKYDIYWLLKSSRFDLFGNGKYGLFLSQKVDGKMMFAGYRKFLIWTFRWWEIRSSFEGDGKYGLLLSQEVDGKIIFTGYWDVLVLNFSVMGNTVFVSVKTLMERWYLLGLFELSMIFQDLGNMVFVQCTLYNLIHFSLPLNPAIHRW